MIRFTLLMTGMTNGIVGRFGEEFKGHPEDYERVDVITVEEHERLLAQAVSDAFFAEKNPLLGLAALNSDRKQGKGA